MREGSNIWERHQQIKNWTQEKNYIRLNSGNACYMSIQNTLAFRSLSKNSGEPVNVSRTILFPGVSNVASTYNFG